MQSILAGTLPVRPFHPNAFVGAVESDGQRPKVAALACEPDGVVICLSLVGPANSVSSALAKLIYPTGRLFFEPAAGINWGEPRVLHRETSVRYKELGARLKGTRETHGLCLPTSAHLGDGLLHPPIIPHDTPATEGPLATPAHDESLIPSTQMAPADSLASLRSALAQARPRYVFGNWAESTPHRRSFLGVLRGLRAVFVNAPPDAAPALTAAMHQWADALWIEGINHALITPLPAIGIRAWRAISPAGAT